MIPGDEAACFLLTREIANVQVVARFTIEGEPVSKARARFTKSGRSYTPDATRTAEAKVAWHFRAAAKAAPPDSANAFGVFGIFFSATRQRRDVDNMLKLLLDGLNKVAWADDTQVTEVSGRKELADEVEHARTEVVVYRLGPIPNRVRPCEQCGKDFPTYRSTTARRFCSRECGQKSRAAARLKTCPACQASFDPKHSRQKYCSKECQRVGHSVESSCIECGNAFRRWTSHAAQKVDACSPECRKAYWRKHRAKAARGTCADCGGPTSKKTYIRCRACRPPGKNLGEVVLTIVDLAREGDL